MATRSVTDDEEVTMTIHIDSDNTKTHISRLPDPKDRGTLFDLFNKTEKDATAVPTMPERFGGMLPARLHTAAGPSQGCSCPVARSR